MIGSNVHICAGQMAWCCGHRVKWHKSHTSTVFISWAAHVPAEWFRFPHVQSFIHMILFNSVSVYPPSLFLKHCQISLENTHPDLHSHTRSRNFSAQAHISDCISWANTMRKVYTPLPSPACRHCHRWLTELHQGQWCFHSSQLLQLHHSVLYM